MADSPSSDAPLAPPPPPEPDKRANEVGDLVPDHHLDQKSQKNWNNLRAIASANLFACTNCLLHLKPMPTNHYEDKWTICDPEDLVAWTAMEKFMEGPSENAVVAVGARPGVLNAM